MCPFFEKGRGLLWIYANVKHCILCGAVDDKNLIASDWVNWQLGY